VSLQDISIKDEYRSLIDNIAKDFYIPLLKQAILYRRAVGFFSSSALIEISKGISGLVENGGRIQLVVSPHLSEEDIEAMRKGYELRNEILEKALLREMHDATSIYERDRLSSLAQLIADGTLDIKIAFTEKEGNFGMYHEKMGIISDRFGNKVAFAGSMNESVNAMTINYEAIDIFRSWDDEKGRVSAKENAFTAIWNDTEPNITVIDFPNFKKEFIVRYKRTQFEYHVDKNEFSDGLYVHQTAKTYYNGALIPASVKLHDFQSDAINEWEKQNFRGIFDMATGTGKTFTGLGAVARLCEFLHDHLAVIIVCPFQHLVEQWVEDIRLFNITPIIGYSSSPQKDWKKRLADEVRNQKLGVSGKYFFCFVCTNATFASDTVQTQIEKIKGDALIVVDEAHNFGATRLSALLPEKFKFRLALSATLERHNDDEGTERLKTYFGKKCIEYSLDRAIEEHKLTPYKYYPIVISLSESELEKYAQLSYEMSRNLIKSKNGKLKLSKYGEILALKRARIVAAASEKIEKLRQRIIPYKDKKYILVYCGATSMPNENSDFSDTSDDDMRQIEVVTDLLGNELNMRVSQFTSREKVGERSILKKEFEKGDTLQVLIAIKCLDEGVNIPNIKTAFILASTTNPKEYIQRRGRVLRLAKGKEFAEIYDFVTLPRPLDEVSSLTTEQMKHDITLVKNELSRVEEFARIAMNSMEASSVIWEIKEAYGLDEQSTEFSTEL